MTFEGANQGKKILRGNGGLNDGMDNGTGAAGRGGEFKFAVKISH